MKGYFCLMPLMVRLMQKMHHLGLSAYIILIIDEVTPLIQHKRVMG